MPFTRNPGPELPSTISATKTLHRTLERRPAAKLTDVGARARTLSVAGTWARATADSEARKIVAAVEAAGTPGQVRTARNAMVLRLRRNIPTPARITSPRELDTLQE